MRYGVFADEPGVLRLSTLLQRWRDRGRNPEDEAEVLRVVDKHRVCPTHGRLEDPIVGLVGDQIAVACPWCSGDAVREAWEAEGRKGTA